MTSGSFGRRGSLGWRPSRSSPPSPSPKQSCPGRRSWGNWGPSEALGTLPALLARPSARLGSSVVPDQYHYDLNAAIEAVEKAKDALADVTAAVGEAVKTGNDEKLRASISTVNGHLGRASSKLHQVYAKVGVPTS